MGVSYGFEPWVQYADSAGKNFAQGMSVAMEQRGAIQRVREQQKAELERQQALIEDEKQQYLGPVKALLKSDQALAEREYNVKFSPEGEPQIDGTFARGFVKTPGYVDKYIGQITARKQGAGLADTLDEMSQLDGLSDTTKKVMAAHSSGMRQGRYAPAEANTIMKEMYTLIQQDRMNSVISGLPPVGTANLDEGWIIRAKPPDMKTGISMPYKQAMTPGELFAQHDMRAYNLGRQAQRQGDLSAADWDRYESSVSFLRTRPQFKDPAYVELVPGGHLMPDALRELVKQNGGVPQPKAGDRIDPSRGAVLSPHGTGEEGAPTTAPYRPTFNIEQPGYKTYPENGKVQIFPELPPRDLPNQGRVADRGYGKQLTSQERQAFANAEFVVNGLFDLADAIDQMRSKKGSWETLTAVAKKEMGQVPVLGNFLRSNKYTAVPPDVAAIQNHIDHIIYRYKSALGGGARLIAATTVQEQMSKSLADVTGYNSASNLRGVAKQLRESLLTQRESDASMGYATPAFRFRLEYSGKREAPVDSPGTQTSPATQRNTGGAGVSGGKTRPPIESFGGGGR